MLQITNNQILLGDALTVLKSLPSETIDCIITSPPYWALRDYKIEGQIGQEKTIDEYVNTLIEVFDECKRVLKKEGTMFVVLGDSYDDNKSLCMIPQRFGIQMLEHGWIVRNIPIWHKRNCMPSSAKDRFTIDYEYIYFFTKSSRYYFKTQYEPMSKTGIERYQYSYGGNQKNVAVSENGKSINNSASRIYFHKKRMLEPSPKGRIKRCVWTINPKPFPDAHFAVFPEELVRQCMDAGCPENGLVLDPFLGSGTTALVALKHNRIFLGIELNPSYVEIAQKRISPLLKQQKLL